MSKTRHILEVAALAILVACGPTVAEEAATPTTTTEKLSYSIGADLGRSFQAQGIDLDAEQLIRGLRDALAGRELALSDEEMRAAMTELQTTLVNKQQEARQRQAAAALETGARFLSENKAKAGVTVLPSGLQYRVLKTGTGKSPAATDMVSVNYVGRLVDGTEFDSSYKRGEPAKFQVNRVIPGWSEALQLMHVGDKWELVIPPNLAYGERGAGGAIPPNAVLVFEVELMGIETQ